MVTYDGGPTCIFGPEHVDNITLEWFWVHDIHGSGRAGGGYVRGLGVPEFISLDTL